eukprot:TRINITY_DN12248_c0_g3_i2.p1 TRINITY_DN12248_c0_g3~~TRINITY_DN12248_c0_g3_i2.p1  ORF type:complete len:369 (-),score=103.88 TRINITY_DN12248_c0_g3_i2:274-1380(-)
MDLRAIVIDNGSGVINAGLSGEEAPLRTFPALVGRPRMLGVMITCFGKSSYVGEECDGRESTINIKSPITEGGLITNFDDAETLWHSAMYLSGLGVAPEDHPLLMSESPSNPVANREKTVQIAFESFNVPSFCLVNSCKLVLVNSGRTTGLVLESGHSGSRAVPLFEGEVQKNALQRTQAGGKAVSAFLSDSLPEKLSRITLEKLKHDIAYVPANDHEFEAKVANDVNFELPDGKVISIGAARFIAGETLFNPSLHKGLTADSPGVQKCVYNAIEAVEEEKRSCFWKSVVLAGGNTNLKGFDERLHRELTNLCGKSQSLKLISPPRREHSVWIGGSVLSSLSTFVSHMCIQKEYYDEFGPQLALGMLR